MEKTNKIMVKVGIMLIRLLAKTWRIKLHGQPPPEKAVIAFWHGQMFPLWKIFAHKNSAAIVSTSKDGEILSAILKKWEYQLIRGSSSRKGAEALQELVQYAGQGQVLITPDGPRGPRHRIKAGAFVAAMRAEVPVIFCSVKIEKAKIFYRSWDLFELPMPFARCNVAFSQPIHINKNATSEEVNAIISKAEEQYK